MRDSGSGGSSKANTAWTTGTPRWWAERRRGPRRRRPRPPRRRRRAREDGQIADDTPLAFHGHHGRTVRDQGSCLLEVGHGAFGSDRAPRQHRGVSSPIVLASSSVYRARVLRDAGWDIRIVEPDVDERSLRHLFDDLGPEAYAVELARRKARSVRGEVDPASLVIGADQVGVRRSGSRAVEVGKPSTPEEAVGQIMAVAGGSYRLVNGVVVVRAGRRPRMERRRHPRRPPRGAGGVRGPVLCRHLPPARRGRRAPHRGWRRDSSTGSTVRAATG